MLVALLWLPCIADADIIFLPCGFYLSCFSSPNFSGCRLDVYHTSTHDVALVQISDACLKCAARSSLEIQDTKNRHLSTITQIYRAVSLQLRHVSTTGKKLVKQQFVLHISPQYGELGPLMADISSGVWGTPANLVVGISQTFQHNRGRHLYSAGRPSRWTLAHILVCYVMHMYIMCMWQPGYQQTACISYANLCLHTLSV